MKARSKARRSARRIAPVLAPIALAPALAVSMASPAESAPVAATVPAATKAPASAAPQGNRTIREAQIRLSWMGLYTGPRTGTYTAQTKAAIRRFQEKYRLPQVGVAGPRTTTLLRKVTAKGPAIDARCKTRGKVICIDKSQRILRAYQNGRLVRVTDARFGAPGMETRQGTFTVYWKSRHHVSREFGGPMPFAMFFSGGQAVHYSSDFARRGYAGSSHGCVNIRSNTSIAWLWNWTPVGTKVVVYRSTV